VGRFTPEKNVRLLAALERNLISAGQRDFNFLLVGEGSEKQWLMKNLQSASFPGTLHGDALAESYANMDAFVFPSRTDTFGLVLLEALASGVPVVVSPETGARTGVQPGVTGFYAEDLNAFTQSVLHLMNNHALRREMGSAARQFALSKTWDAVFEQLYRTYETGLQKIAHHNFTLR